MVVFYEVTTQCQEKPVTRNQPRNHENNLGVPALN